MLITQSIKVWRTLSETEHGIFDFFVSHGLANLRAQPTKPALRDIKKPIVAFENFARFDEVA